MTDASAPRRTRLAPRLLLEALVLVVLSFAGRALLVDAETINRGEAGIDEAGWMAAGHDTWQLLLERRAVPQHRWSEGIQETSYGYCNPAFGKLLIGWRLERMGYAMPVPKVFPYLFPLKASEAYKSTEWVSDKLREYRRYIQELRVLNAWLMALGAVGVYLVGRLLGGRLLGLAAWGWFVATPLVREVAWPIGTDTTLLLTGLLALAAMLAFVDRWTRERTSVLALAGGVALIGVLLGLTASSKLNGAVQGFVFALALGGLWVRGRFRAYRPWEPALWLALAATCTFGTFYLTNPYLWPDPVVGTQRILSRWKLILGYQNEAVVRGTIDGTAGKLGAVLEMGVLEAAPLGALTPVVVPALVFGGLLLLGGRALRSLRGGDESVRPWIVLVWIALWVVATTAWIPFRWERYVLPVAAPVSLLATYPLVEGLRVGWRRLRRAPAAQ